MNRIITGIAFLTFLFTATAAYAPETGPADRADFEELAYRVLEDGSIIDGSGNPKGWMVGNEVYDKGWRLKYRLEGKRLHDASGM
jgi:hypothetical protein